MSYHDDSKLSNRFLSLRKKIDKTATSACLQDNKNAEIFVGLTNALFASLIYQEREKILQELGNPKLEISWHRQDRFRGNDVVEFAMKKLNRSRIQATRIVGERLGIRPENCFDAFPITQNNETNNNSELRPLSDFIPENIDVGNKKYKLSYIDEQKNFGGEIEQEICCYSTTENDCFFLIAIAVQEKYKTKKFHGIGYAPATALAFSRVAIDKSPDAHVIFPMSLPVAFHLRRLCRKDHIGERSFIVSGHFGGIDALDLKCFQGRKVILLPEFSHDGLFEADRIAEKLKSIARDVKIYPWPIMADGMPDEAMTAGAGSPWKQSLLEQKVDLREELAPSSLLNRITNKALSRSSFKKLLAEIGLSLAGEEASQEDYEALPVSTLGEVANSPAIDIDAEPSLDLLIKPHYILFMWGGSHSGKSFILLTLILGVATGTRAFCLSGSTQPRKVLLLDGELTKDQFMQRLGQLTQNNRALLDSASKNICCYFAREAGSLDLLNPDHQKSILARIKKDGIEVLAIDNLISLAEGALKGGGSGGLFEFFYTVEREGVAVVFVSHATKGNAQSKGSVDIESKSQTIIQIQGRNVLSRDNDISDAVKLALEKGGDIVVRLTFDKCKLPPKLNNKYEVYHLPVDGNWNYIEGNVPRDRPLDVTTFDEGIANGPDSSDERLVRDNCIVESLSEDSQSLNKLFQDGKKYSRAEVEAHFNWGEDKAGNELKNLKKVGLITPIGSGRTTAYRKK